MTQYTVGEGVKAWAITTGGHGLSLPQSESSDTEGSN